MRDEIYQLRKEAAHWKRLVNEQSEKSDAMKVSLFNFLINVRCRSHDRCIIICQMWIFCREIFFSV